MHRQGQPRPLGPSAPVVAGAAVAGLAAGAHALPTGSGASLAASCVSHTAAGVVTSASLAVHAWSTWPHDPPACRQCRRDGRLLGLRRPGVKRCAGCGGGGCSNPSTARRAPRWVPAAGCWRLAAGCCPLDARPLLHSLESLCLSSNRASPVPSLAAPLHRPEPA